MRSVFLLLISLTFLYSEKNIVFEKANSPLPETKINFLNAADWNDGKAEILSYSVEKSYRGEELLFNSDVLTEREYLNTKSGICAHKAGEEDIGVFAMTLQYQFISDTLITQFSTSLKTNMEWPLHIIRQETAIQSWLGLSWRSIKQNENGIRLSLLSSGLEANRESDLNKTDILSEELLFLYLRNLPFASGYSEEIWLLDSQFNEKAPTNVQYAKIKVESKTVSVQERVTWPVTVTKADGQKLFFWISVDGLHPIVKAILADKSIWNLEKIQRKKYWTW